MSISLPSNSICHSAGQDHRLPTHLLPQDIESGVGHPSRHRLNSEIPLPHSRLRPSNPVHDQQHPARLQDLFGLPHELFRRAELMQCVEGADQVELLPQRADLLRTQAPAGSPSVGMGIYPHPLYASAGQCPQRVPPTAAHIQDPATGRKQLHDQFDRRLIPKHFPTANSPSHQVSPRKGHNLTWATGAALLHLNPLTLHDMADDPVGLPFPVEEGSELLELALRHGDEQAP